MIKYLFYVFVFVFSLNLSAAIPKKILSYGKNKPSHISNQPIEMIMRLPFKNRIQVLKSLGTKKALKQLEELAFNPKKSLQLRWRAVTSIGSINRDSPLLVKAMQSREWYMRNAAMISLKKAPRKMVLKWTKKLLKDPALVVRTASVDLIKERGLKELEKDLWTEMGSSTNFRKGKSLWIRAYIASALSQFARKGQEKQFIALLKDADTRVHKSAILGLERLTRVKKGKTLKEKRTAWIQWGQTI